MFDKCAEEVRVLFESAEEVRILVDFCLCVDGFPHAIRTDIHLQERSRIAVSHRNRIAEVAALDTHADRMHNVHWVGSL